MNSCYSQKVRLNVCEFGIGTVVTPTEEALDRVMGLFREPYEILGIRYIKGNENIPGRWQIQIVEYNSGGLGWWVASRFRKV